MALPGYHVRMILYACADLIFSTRIGSTAQAVGVAARPVRGADDLQQRLDRVEDGQPNDPPTALLLDLDLGETALAMIRQVQAHDQRIPVIAFGAHVAREMLQAARDAGADGVLPRGAFVQRLPDLLRQCEGQA